MAESGFSKNGNQVPHIAGLVNIKVLVVGEPRVGKSAFIETFIGPNNSNDFNVGEYCRIYQIRYNISNRSRHVSIFELNGFKGEDPSEALKNHKDANGFILMYAIDDPSSFERVTDKWYANLQDMIQHKEQTILVGNKRDLRDNPQVIQRLARNNQIPVTEEQGQNLVKEKEKIGKYFDCSSTQNQNVNEAFEVVLGGALANLTNKAIFPNDASNPEPEDD